MRFKRLLVHIRKFYRFLKFIEEKRIEYMIKSGKASF